jgi:hypothetical protein
LALIRLTKTCKHPHFILTAALRKILIIYTPTRRVAIAIALSALMHAAILWLPQIRLPYAKVELPPLTVRIEHLPEIRKAPAEKSTHGHPATGAGTEDKQATVTAPAMRKMPAMDATAEPVAPPPFPKHLQLTFAVYRNGDRFASGELRHKLDIGGDKYTLKATLRPAGLTSLHNSIQLIRISRGKIDTRGLRPEIFVQEEFSAGGKQSLKAEFDWAAHKLRFSSGNDAELPADAQDMLSFMYQLSQIPLDSELFLLPISDGSQMESYQIEIGVKEVISTPLGKLRALHLRKTHGPNEAYFDIWLGLEYRLLPVKLIWIDSSGNMTDEYAISDIRATDD